MTTQRPLPLLALLLLTLLASPAQGLTLQAGDLVVSGFSYAPFAPPGACVDQLCLVNPISGAVTPFAPVPSYATYGVPRSLVVDSTTSVLVRTPSAIVRVDTESGTATPLATGLTGNEELVRTPAGRLFVRQGSSVQEVDPVTGQLTPLISGVFVMAAGANESLLFGSTTLIPGASLVSLDLGSSALTEVAAPFGGFASALGVGSQGDIYAFFDVGGLTERIVARFGGPAGNLIYASGQAYYDSCSGVGLGVSGGGSLFVRCDAAPLAGSGFDEFEIFDPSGAQSSLDLDFGVGAFTFATVPEPTTAFLLALGLVGLSRVTRRRAR